MRLVTMVAPCLLTPRVVMHWCVAWITTADPVRLQHGVEGVGDLRREPLLHLQAARERVDEAGELRDADHAIARQVADVHLPADRRHVVLAERLEADVAQDHDLVVAADLLEGAPQTSPGSAA